MHDFTIPHQPLKLTVLGALTLLAGIALFFADSWVPDADAHPLPKSIRYGSYLLLAVGAVLVAYRRGVVIHDGNKTATFFSKLGIVFRRRVESIEKATHVALSREVRGRGKKLRDTFPVRIVGGGRQLEVADPHTHEEGARTARNTASFLGLDVEDTTGV